MSENPNIPEVREKLVVPEGMSKRAYKRQLKQEQIAKERPEFIAKRAEKRRRLKAERLAKKAQEDAERAESGAPVEPDTEAAAPSTKRHKHAGQPSPMSIIIDCAFDELMKEGERTSLARQIVRCYSENRRAEHPINLSVTSFNSGLKTIFDGNMKGQYKLWRDIKFDEGDFTKDGKLNVEGPVVYLSSDSDNLIEDLDENTTYIVGGIVDKGRYKDLCKTKAEKYSIPTARLPIDETIKLSGRRVLTTNHVVELMLKWLEVRNWKDAFEAILPVRKLGTGEDRTESVEPETAPEAPENDQ